MRSHRLRWLPPFARTTPAFVGVFQADRELLIWSTVRTTHPALVVCFSPTSAHTWSTVLQLHSRRKTLMRLGWSFEEGEILILMICPWSVIQLCRFVPPWRDKGDACSAHGECSDFKSCGSTLYSLSASKTQRGRGYSLLW